MIVVLDDEPLINLSVSTVNILTKLQNINKIMCQEYYAFKYL